MHTFLCLISECFSTILSPHAVDVRLHCCGTSVGAVQNYSRPTAALNIPEDVNPNTGIFTDIWYTWSVSFTQPTERISHDVLGNFIEADWPATWLAGDTPLHKKLGMHSIFEDRKPRRADIDDDGRGGSSFLNLRGISIPSFRR